MPSGGDGPGGEIDLPVVPSYDRSGRGPSPFAPPGGGGHIDLPAAVSAPRGAAAAFGALDLGTDGDDGGSVDLPATRGAASYGGSMPDFGAIDLPAARPQAPAYAPAPGPGYGSHASSASGLPAVFGSSESANTGLPSPFSGGGPGLPTPMHGYGAAGLPVAQGGSGGSGLPLPAHGAAGLPSPSMGNAGLPLPGIGMAGLPVPGSGGAGLPLPSGGGLPMPSAGGLPSASAGGFPVASTGGFPVASAGGLPAHSPAGFPQAGGPGLPQAGGHGLPSMSAGGLPSASGPGLPLSSQGGLPSSSHSGLPVVGAAGLPAATTAGLPAFDPSVGSGAGGPFAFDLHDGGGTAVMESGSGVGGEIDLDGSKLGAPQIRQPRQPSTLADDGPAKKSKGLKIAGAFIGVLGVAGLVTAFIPSLGPFGYYAITDKLNAEQYDGALAELRTQVQTDLDEDTLTAGTVAMDKVRSAHSARDRHDDTTAYAAFVLWMRCVRFGREGATEQNAKTLFDKSEHGRGTVPELLASAAADVLAGELPRAKATLEQVQAKQPDDVDAAVLQGEIDLVAKAPDQALAAFTRAVNAHKSARTLYGLARAQLALGKLTEAEATAKNVLELSKNHAGARVLLATVAASQDREEQAIELLTSVTKDPKIRPGASPGELVDAYVQIGRVQLGALRMSLAQEAFDEALKLNTQAVSALVGRGEVFFRSGRFSNAEANFDSAVKADADNLDAKIGLVKTWISLERYKEAKDLLAKLQTSHDADPRVDYWLGVVSLALGNRKDAEAFYASAINKAKTADLAVPAYVGLSTLMASSNRAEDAAKKLAEAAEKFPDSAEVSRARGLVALEGGNYADAKAQLEEALQRDPNHLGTRFSLGSVLRRMRKFDEAIAVFDKVAEVDPEFPGLALERGLFYEETGKTDEAIKMYQAALEKAPNDVDLKLRIGSTLVTAGAAKQAEPLLKDVLRDRQNSAEANHFLGRAMLLSGSNLNEAIRYLKRAIEIDGNRAEYHLYVGFAAIEAGQYNIASTSLEKALELDPTLGDAYWQRGVLFQRQGRCVDAIRDLEIALEKKKSRYEAHASLAACYEEQNNPTKAEVSWRKAIEGNPKIAEWHHKLGLLLDRKNDSKGAIEELEKAIELSQGQEPRPGWLSKAHLVLGESYGTATKDKCASNLKEYLRIAPQDEAYRQDAQRLLDQCQTK